MDEGQGPREQGWVRSGAWRTFHASPALPSGAAPEDFRSLVQTLVDRLAGTFDVLTVTVRLWDEADRVLRLVATAAKVRVPSEQPPSAGIGMTALREGRVVVSNDYASDPTSWRVLVEQGVRSSVAIPIRVDDRSVGVVAITSGNQGFFVPERVATFHMLADHLGALLERVEIEEAERHHARTLEVLFEVSRVLSTPQPLTARLRAALDEVVRKAGATAAALRVPDEHNRVLRMEAAAGDRRVTTVLRPDVPFDDEAAAATAFRTGLAVVINHYATFPGADARLVACGIQSTMALPVRYESRDIGVLVISSVKDDYFSPELVRLLSSIAQNLGVLLEHARLQEADRRHAAADGALAAIARALADKGSFELKVRAVLELLADISGADIVSLRVPMADGQNLGLVAAAPAGPSAESVARVIPFEGTHAGNAMRQGQPVVSNNIAEDDRVSPFTRAYAQEVRTQSLVSLPVIVDGRVIGAIIASSTKPDHFTVERVQLLTRVAAGIGILTQNAQLQDELRRHAAELEAQVEHRTRELRKANEELEAFAYSVSHDLRAPLRALDGFSQALLDDNKERLDDQGTHYLQRIRQAAQRMGSLIDEILALSRVSRAEMVRQPVDLSRIAHEVVEALRQRNPDRQVRLAIRDGLTAQGDPALLRIVLENLLDNAWKFTSSHVSATIEFAPSTDGEEQTFCVRDDGVGFDPAYIDKLFKPFQRLHSVEEFPGNGVGLATVERIVRRHGGRVWARGAPGEGATFYFTLGQ